MREGYSYASVHRVRVRCFYSGILTEFWVLKWMALCALHVFPRSLISNFLIDHNVCDTAVFLGKESITVWPDVRENVSNSSHYEGWKVLNFHHLPWSRTKMWDTHMLTLLVQWKWNPLHHYHHHHSGLLIMRKLISLKCSVLLFSLPKLHAPLFISNPLLFPSKLLQLDAFFCKKCYEDRILWLILPGFEVEALVCTKNGLFLLVFRNEGSGNGSYPIMLWNADRTCQNGEKVGHSVYRHIESGMCMPLWDSFIALLIDRVSACIIIIIICIWQVLPALLKSLTVDMWCPVDSMQHSVLYYHHPLHVFWIQSTL